MKSNNTTTFCLLCILQFLKHSFHNLIFFKFSEQCQEANGAGIINYFTDEKTEPH